MKSSNLKVGVKWSLRNLLFSTIHEKFENFGDPDSLVVFHTLIFLTVEFLAADFQSFEVVYF